jgi:hypothetical protein
VLAIGQDLDGAATIEGCSRLLWGVIRLPITRRVTIRSSEELTDAVIEIFTRITVVRVMETLCYA